MVTLELTNNGRFTNGHIPWIKGRNHSAEARKKMSESNLKYPRRYWLGKKLSEETKRK